MASNFEVKLLLFNIIFEENELELELYNYETFADLKEAISNKFDIPPEHQLIHSWYETPPTDDTILDSCCGDDSYVRTLIVERKLMVEKMEEGDTVEESWDSRNGHENSDSTDSPNVEVPNNYRELENSAAFSFIQYFFKNYTNNNIAFHICCLNDALREACLTSVIKSRKILLLYFHNKNDGFSKIFCTNLVKNEVNTLLSNSFFLLGWDVENDEYRDALKFALTQKPELSNLTTMLEKKISAALLIMPIKDSITIYSCMRGKISDSNISTTLKQAESFLKNENSAEENLQENTNENDLGSVNFQQLMLDLLGDRDYDSFEYCEHAALKDKIGYALYGPPKEDSGYNSKENKEIYRLYKIIVDENNLIAKWKDRVILSFIYVCLEPLPDEQLKRKKKYSDYNPKTDIMPLPIFVLRKCKNSSNPCRVFIDNTGRVYESWLDYIQHNKLHKCQMILPKDGRYQADEEGHVLLETHLSPACGIDVKILQGVDIASTAVGLASGGVFIAAAIPAITVAPVALTVAVVAGAAVGTYSIVRSAISLVDRSRHKETMSFANSEARGAYINIIAGSLGFVGVGANIAVTQLAAQGFQIGKGATTVVNVINVANLTAGGAGILNSSYDVIDQWLSENRGPSLLTIVQLSSSILFFGHALYNFRSAGTIIEESQANALKDIQDSLRSNRHRKTFNKLLKATIRNNEGNVQKGQAEVISTVRNIKNRDEVFAALTRSNKDMKQYDIKFIAENGQIRLNGIVIDMDKFASFDKSQRITFLQDLSTTSTQQPSPNQINNIKFKLTDLCSNFSLQDLTQLSINVARIFLGSPAEIKDKIIDAVCVLIKYLTNNSPNYLEVLDAIFSQSQQFFKLFLMVTQCFQRLVDNVEEQYQIWLRTRDVTYKQPIFVDLAFDFSKRAIQIFRYVTEAYYIGTSLNENGLKLVLNYFYAWITKQIEDYEDRKERLERRVEHSATPTTKVKCDKCNGEYYRR